MRHALLICEFLSTPWAILPERLSAMCAVIARWAAEREASPEVMAQVRADAAQIEARRGEATRSGNGAIAVLPFYGISAQRTSPMDDVSGTGLMSIQRYTQAFRAALADDSIGGILMDIDSPGGSVYGVMELANEIYQARNQKPVYAISNSLAASAAYWIASSASEFYVTPGGEVGSIGVFAAHQNLAKALEKEGVETTLISAGKYKTEGNPFGPLSDEARAAMQTRVDAYYGAFTRGVAKNRGVDVATVREGMGQGRVLSASSAKAENMVDGVATFDEVVRKLAKTIGQGGTQSQAPKPSRAALLQRQIDLLDA
ncbi:S49 family peptidase [Burkholderia pseudomallei]|uniref:S49 family peptidase n=1 Tax=Burkholderia pseudomallei TaxID=28450 RepID=UPI0010A9448F|nr:S49 family peptidase [Burkholderia pseudomallei]MBF3389890.1 S49 family peptidase [Burkholderia pseudomallei]MBF3426227.1 S49 family peptidase [Burkholderia pseudomallei]MBF3503823.1 S49 family peptidase [Burkholderia pseudomallei]MBF3689912.1 S49 family peptidase [Burkholderia pseudomallei]MBF3707940.1 S49 family peptidase [Burkholderia pseudomallei]